MPNKPTYEELEQRLLVSEEDSIKRKKVEEALIESRERLDLALKSTDLGIWDYDIIQDEATEQMYNLAGVDDEAGRLADDEDRVLLEYGVGQQQ